MQDSDESKWYSIGVHFRLFFRLPQIFSIFRPSSISHLIALNYQAKDTNSWSSSLCYFLHSTVMSPSWRLIFHFALCSLHILVASLFTGSAHTDSRRVPEEWWGLSSCLAQCSGLCSLHLYSPFRTARDTHDTIIWVITTYTVTNNQTVLMPWDHYFLDVRPKLPIQSYMASKILIFPVLYTRYIALKPILLSYIYL